MIFKSFFIYCSLNRFLQQKLFFRPFLFHFPLHKKSYLTYQTPPSDELDYPNLEYMIILFSDYQKIIHIKNPEKIPKNPKMSWNIPHCE